MASAALSMARRSDNGAARAPRGEVGPGDPGAEPPWDPAADFSRLSARNMRTALGARFDRFPVSPGAGLVASERGGADNGPVVPGGARPGGSLRKVLTP